MSEFEITQKEPAREKIYSIEKSDQDYYRRPENSSEYPKLTPMHMEDIRQEIKNAKSKSETVKKQTRKVPSKRNKSAMA